MSAGRIRLLYVLGDFKGGGTQRYLLTLLRGLDRGRFDPTLACLSESGDLRRAFDSVNVAIECHPVRDALWHPRSLRTILGLAGRIRGRFDLVHTLLGHANVVGLLAARLAGQSCVLASQRSLHPGSFRSAGPGLVTVGRWLFRHAARRILVNNPAIVDSLVTQGIPASRIALIPNGIDTGRFRPLADRQGARRQAGIAGDDFVVGFAGRLISEKGAARLLEAAEPLVSRHPSLRISILGDGPERPGLEAIAARGALHGRVDFLGFREDPEAVYPLFDALAFPSTYPEGTPNVVLEAMACGVPAVVRRMVQIEGMLHDGENAVVFESEAPRALEMAIESLLRDRRRAVAIGAAGRELVGARHSLPGMLRATQDLYEREAAGSTA